MSAEVSLAMVTAKTVGYTGRIRQHGEMNIIEQLISIISAFIFGMCVREWIRRKT